MSLSSQVRTIQRQSAIPLETGPRALGVIGNYDPFTVVGPVMITTLTAYVLAITTALAATMRVSLIGVIGATTLDSAAVATNAVAAGSWLQLPDSPVAQPCTWVPTIIPVANYVFGVGFNSIALGTDTGTVRYAIAAQNSNTGTVVWILHYIPLRRGSMVVANW